MNLQSKFGYFIITQTLNIALCKRDGITEGRTNRQTDDLITRFPRRTFQAGGIKTNVTFLVRDRENVCNRFVTADDVNYISADVHIQRIFLIAF